MVQSCNVRALLKYCSASLSTCGVSGVGSSEGVGWGGGVETNMPGHKFKTILRSQNKNSVNSQRKNDQESNKTNNKHEPQTRRSKRTDLEHVIGHVGGALHGPVVVQAAVFLQVARKCFKRFIQTSASVDLLHHQFEALFWWIGIPAELADHPGSARATGGGLGSESRLGVLVANRSSPFSYVDSSVLRHDEIVPLLPSVLRDVSAYKCQGRRPIPQSHWNSRCRFSLISALLSSILSILLLSSPILVS